MVMPAVQEAEKVNGFNSQVPKAMTIPAFSKTLLALCNEVGLTAKATAKVNTSMSNQKQSNK